MPKKKKNRKKQPKHTNWAGRTPTQDRLSEGQLRHANVTHLAERAQRLAERATEYLGSAGAVIEQRDGSVLVNGEPVVPGGSGTLDVIDEIGLQHYGHRLQDAAQSQLVQRIPGLTLHRRSRLLEIQRDGKRIGLIKPTHASIEADHGHRIEGNFLLAGHHCWEELRAGLGAATPTTVLTKLPETATAQQRQRAITASTRIRDTRSRDYAARARIHREVDGVTIAFQRISPSRPLEVPFELTNHDGSTIRAALRLSGAGDILPLAMTAASPDSTTLVTEWLIALETFAHLTCAYTDGAARSDNANPASRTPGQRTGSHTAQTTAAPLRHLRPVPASRSASPSEIPADLIPTLVTAHALTHHHVVGHPHQLHTGKPDPEKVRVAATLGIKLPPGATWVASHWRGTGDDPELEFNWRTEASASHLNQNAA
jgi:hypothetical protein